MSEEPIEVLSVRVEADAQDLLQGTRQAVKEASGILSEIPPVTPQINSLPMLGRITEIINRYSELQLTVENVVGVINNGMRSGASEAEKLAQILMELSVVQSQSFKESGQWMVGSGAISQGEYQAALDFAAQVGPTLRASQAEVIAFAKQLDGVRASLHDLGMAAVETQKDLTQMAQTEVNMSPLAASLDRLRERLIGVWEWATRAQQPLQQMGQIEVNIGSLTEGQVRSLVESREEVSRLWEELARGQEPQRAVTQRFEQLREVIGNALRTPITLFQNLRARIFGVTEALSAARVSAETFNRVISQGSRESSTAIQQMSAFVMKASKENNLSFQEIINGMLDSKMISKDAGKAITSELDKATGSTGLLARAFGGLGTIARSVFGAAIGLGAVQVLRRFIRLATEAAMTAIQLQTAIIRLDIAVRAAQRAQGEAVGTMQEWHDTVAELRSQFTNLGELELTQAASRTVLLTRELRLNQEQMEAVYRQAVILASVHGVDINQALTLVVQGLTGIGRGLRKYGVFLSRAQLNAEAFRMGLNKTWTELDSNERALVALNVIMRQTEPLVEDLGEYYQTLGARMETANKGIKDSAADLGAIFGPVVVRVKEWIAALLQYVAVAAESFNHLWVMLGAGLAGLAEYVRALSEGASAQEAWLRSQEAVDQAILRLGKLYGLLGSGLEDITEATLDLGEETDETLEKMLEALSNYGDQFENALRAFEEGVDEAGETLQQDLADLETEYTRDLEEAFERYLQELDDLARNYARKREDIIREAQQRLEDLEDQNDEARRKAREEFLVKMRRMEEDYQRDLRRLREKFSEDMREAIANRDAWQAVQLIRNFRKDRRHLREDYETKRSRAEEDFQRRMAELDYRDEIERQKILERMRRELEDLDIWLARRREEISEDYGYRLEDLAIQNAREEAELRDSYDQRLADLRLSLERRLAAIAQAMADEAAITAAGAQEVFLALFKVFGFGGNVDQLMDAFEKRMARNIRIQVAVERAMEETQDTIPEFRTGGAIIAREPTLVQFGEVPEIATFAPLAALGQLRTEAHSIGTLEIHVTADDHFSEDFESMVATQIAGFVNRVTRR